MPIDTHPAVPKSKLRDYLQEENPHHAQYDCDLFNRWHAERIYTLRRMVGLVLWDPETGGPSNCSDSNDEHPCGHCWACSLRDDMEAQI